MSYIPNRSNKNAVARFADCIATIDANYPEVVVFADHHYSNIGEFRNFLRHAVLGISKYGISHPKLKNLHWSEDYKTRILDGKCLVGSPEKLKDYTLDTVKTVGLTVDADVRVSSTAPEITPESVDILSAILTLHDHGYLEDTKFDLNLAPVIEELVVKLGLDTDTHKTDTHIHIF